MDTINTTLEYIKAIDDIKEKEKNLYKKANEIFNDIKIEEFEKLSYEECKYIYDYVFYRINDELRESLGKITHEKKIKLYPEMLKPHYYPELDRLKINDNDKLEIDTFIRQHLRYILNPRVLVKCKPLLDNIDSLVDLGIVSKNYSFMCYCGSQSSVKSEEEMNACFKIWELEKKEHTTENSLELEKLYEKYGFGVISLNCFDCDEEETVEITNLDEFNEYLNDGFVEVYYKIIKNPDLTYEKK